MSETTTYSYENLRPSLNAVEDYLRIPGNADRVEAQIKARAAEVIAEHGNVKDEGFEIPEELRSVRLWDAMLEKQIIKPSHRDAFNKESPTLGDFADAKFNIVDILRRPGLGLKTAREIASFIVSNYGFSIDVGVSAPEHGSETVGDVPDVVNEFEADLDTFVGEVIDFEAVGVSKIGKERLAEAGVITVGDFFLITNDRLKNEFKVPDAQVRKLRDFIIQQYGIPKYFFTNPGVIPSIVRARTAAAKVKIS